jgi:hypothetical protein
MYQYVCSKCDKPREGILPTTHTAWKCPECGGAPRFEELKIPDAILSNAAEGFFKFLADADGVEALTGAAPCDSFIEKGEQPEPTTSFDRSFMLCRRQRAQGKGLAVDMVFLVTLDARYTIIDEKEEKKSAE